jgi:hypothetical protein
MPFEYVGGADKRRGTNSETKKRARLALCLASSNVARCSIRCRKAKREICLPCLDRWAQCLRELRCERRRGLATIAFCEQGPKSFGNALCEEKNK